MKILDSIGRRLLLRSGWLGSMATYLADSHEGRHGPVYARRRHEEAIADGRSITRGLAEIHSRWPDVQSKTQDSPVFILSAGWRSGSTLMQRLVMSANTILVWGEPYSHARFVHHLANVASSITRDWPEDSWFVSQYELDKLGETFTANLYPEVQDMLQASHAYMRILLEEPARERGFSRWGLKDVRLTIDDARFLRWIYPKAKIVFICRNPYDAYRSYRIDRSWYNEWPDDPVFTAERFGRHWRTLADGFRTGWSDVDGMLVRYEDLCSGVAPVGQLENYLEMNLDASLLERKVGAHHKKSSEIPRAEFRKLRKEVSVVAEAMGYDLDG